MLRAIPHAHVGIFMWLYKSFQFNLHFQKKTWIFLIVYYHNPPPQRDDTDQDSLKEKYSETKYYPYFSIKKKRIILKYPVVPSLGNDPVQSKKKIKFKYHDLDNDTRCGYESDNQCGTLIDAFVGDYYYDDDNNTPNSMVGECRDINRTGYEAGKLVFLKKMKCTN